MEAEEFCLKWKNHHHVLISLLDKLLENESMCDVTLAAEQQFLKVHRIVVCACSSYFEVCHYKTLMGCGGNADELLVAFCLGSPQQSD